MPRRKPHAIPNALLDQLLDGADPRAAFHPNGVKECRKGSSEPRGAYLRRQTGLLMHAIIHAAEYC
jgi:hypothetical protein